MLPIDAFLIAILIIITAIIVGVIAFAMGVSYRKRIAEAKIGSAEERASKIIDDAITASEAKKREIMLEAKEETLKAKNELDQEIREREESYSV